MDDYPNERDYWEYREELSQYSYEFESLDNIYKEIELIVDDPKLGLYKDECSEYEFSKYIVFCACCESGEEISPKKYNSKIWFENYKHTENCPIEKLRSLVNTLGDMIA